MYELFFLENTRFTTWSFQHIGVVLVSAILGYLIIRYAQAQKEEIKQQQIFNALGVFVSATVIVWTLLEIGRGKFSYKEDLPLVICNFLALTIPVFTFTRSKKVYELILFWILAGTVQAIITPDLLDGFPHYTFMKFWIVHNGLVIIVLYATFVWGYRPTLRGLFRSYIGLEIYFLIMMGINALFDTNYFYLNAKPPFATVLDLFGPWPWYIIVAQLIVIPYFLLLYLPFYLSRQRLRSTIEAKTP
ncbi:MAG: TIGR02206 family membrane protein [Bacteroidia bacterium]|nr:TIGR02206 family membrane protein [Bacteroidia bacterium]